jgi:hypothetical protein
MRVGPKASIETTNLFGNQWMIVDLKIINISFVTAIIDQKVLNVVEVKSNELTLLIHQRPENNFQQ